MSRAWFGRKRVGWGLRPVSWQGWAVTALYVLLVLGLGSGLSAHHFALFLSALVVLSAVYLVVARATSSGSR